MMDWEPHVGMRVVCVVDVTPASIAKFPAQWPYKGGVYTIETVNHWPVQGTLLTFLELDNTDFVARGESQIEPGFSQWGFRPLDERRLDIFRSILTKAPTEKEPA